MGTLALSFAVASSLHRAVQLDQEDVCEGGRNMTHLTQPDTHDG